MRTYRIVLYKNIEERWHYVLLTANAGEFRTETGICGYTSSTEETKSLPADADIKETLRKAGAEWQRIGYHKPDTHQLPVMTLHFKLPKWRGYPAGAPWFDEWTTWYLDPIREALDATVNGIAKGEERFSGNYLFYYAVPNPEMARQTLALIGATSPVQYDLEIYIGEAGKTVPIPIDPDVPEFLQSFLRGFEASARVLSDGLSKLIHIDPLKPELVFTAAQSRIRNEQASRIRQELKSRWNFECVYWDPYNQQVPVEIIELDQLADPQTQQLLLGHLRAIAQTPFYLLDCQNGLFTIEPDQLFEGAYEGMVFDDSFDWVIYFSEHHSVSFAGQTLAPAIQQLLQHKIAANADLVRQGA